MSTEPTKLITHDHRKLFPEVYAVKQGPVRIQQIPSLKYVSQDMNTAFHMDWAGRPEPIDEQWIVWKIVNQLKQITKNSLGYKFKLMPPEIIWHKENENKTYSITQMMQVPDCITQEMYEAARAKVEKNLPGQSIPKTHFITANLVLCAQKLHVGHYQDTISAFQEIEDFCLEKGYRTKGSRKEIYLTPAMRCHPPETWKTIVCVEVEKVT